MSDLTPADFDVYFKAVHGHEPYPWQSRLTRQVLAEEKWPTVIDLPTGTGKTAVLDTAIFALAARPAVFPRRIVFVIDRRIVVDQVYERAERISDKIKSASNGVLAELKARLSKLTDADEPLGVAALRGGIPIDGEWARRPEQPWVMVSTVDQFGSRLLFRGYGVSERMRPVHAGLAGNDCLVILDEVHLSQAFAHTLREASSIGEIPSVCSVNSDLLPRRFQIVEMSATPANDGANRFRLVPEDLQASPRLKQIAEARKRATLVEVGGTSPPHETVPKKVLRLLEKELRADEKSVGVIVNRVRTARETHAALREKGIAAHLVTGRMRPLDRERALKEISRCVDPDRSSPLDERTVVVATQAIEVGADFSFDALITEAAPTDSLRQRLGRLDRRGTLAAEPGSPARCWILGVASALKPKFPDPVYGDSARVAWEELQAHAEDGEIDVGPGSDLFERLDKDALAPKAEAPLVLPTHIDAWSQTSPKPVADPPISEFLHGKENLREPDVSIVWRWDRSDAALALVPPRPAEFLSVPISAVKSWLKGTAESPVADTATMAAEDGARSSRRDRGKQESAKRNLGRVVRWTRRAAEPTEELESVDDISPGDLIIADPMLGGLRHGTWDPGCRPTSTGETSDHEASVPVEDLGDRAQLAQTVQAARLDRSTRATLRLDPRLHEGLLRRLRARVVIGGFGDSDAPALRMPSPEDERDASRTTRATVDEWLSELQGLPAGELPDWMTRVVDHFQSNGRFDIEVIDAASGADYYVLVGRAVDPAILDESDDAPSLTRTATPLRSHLEGVGVKAAKYGRRLGLSDELVDDLRLAGELHDLGKVDSRFQAQLHGHDPVRIAESAATGEWLAKSLPDAQPRRWGWPPVRHEFSSVALVRSHPDVLAAAHDPDLVLHLVGTHHGFGRPLPQIKEDDDPQGLVAVGQFGDGGFRLCLSEDDAPGVPGGSGDHMLMGASTDLAGTSLALEMADRFWRLQERYGHHGLAWLEAILRLADQQRSAEEERRGNDD